jgi:hypothetical protein
MPSELYAFLQPIVLDTVKILGPAVVAGYAAYKAASVQIELKLRELESQNTFKARELIFNHLREKLVHIEKEAQKHDNELGKILGMAAAEFEASPDSQPTEYIKILVSSLKVSLTTAPAEARSLLVQMRLAGLETTDECKQLISWDQRFREIEVSMSYDGLKSMILSLVETYQVMGACTRKLLEHQIERTLTPYATKDK